MQQTTTRLLYRYWNDVRSLRIAPRRYEIEPMKIAALLPETFIVECAGLHDFRFRLAGTRLCEQFGRELRGQGLLDLWQEADQTALERVLHRIVLNADIGIVRFQSLADDGRTARFEMVLLPLIHDGTSINRLMGSISAIEPPSWLGSRALVRHAIVDLEVRPPTPDGNSRSPAALPARASQPAPMLIQKGERSFRVYDGGRPEG